MKRYKMSSRNSKRTFRKGTKKVNAVNNWQPLRGGIRL